MATQDMVTENMRRKAELLASLIPTFSRGRDKRTGIRYVTVPSSDDPLHTGHNATPHWCSCAGYDRRGVCTHQLAVRLHEEREQTARNKAAQRQARPLASEAEIDLAFAETATRLRGNHAGAAITTFGTCISRQGCQEPAIGRSKLCGRHLDALVETL